MKRNLTLVINFIWSFFKYALLAVAAALVLILILLGSAYGDLKNAAVQGLAGKNSLNEALTAAQAADWTLALSKAAEAQTKFSAGLENIDQARSNSAIKNIGLVRVQIDDLEYLLKTMDILSRSLERVIPIAQQLEAIRSGVSSHNFNDLPAADKNRFLQLIYESAPEINGLKANLDLASLNLDRIRKIGVFWPIYSQISNLNQEIKQVSTLMIRVSPLIRLLPVLAGYPEASHFLLIMQNNDELRATGGFIGVYGLLDIQSGQLLSLTADDSYHLDMPASQSDKWNLEPPAPIKKYLKVEKWYLRDANWSPDWPQAANKITEIYAGEIAAVNQTAAPFTGIVAITPDLVADLISLVGPITAGGAQYDAANFQPLLQYNVEVAYKDQAISAWDRKNIINELMGELKKRLFNLSASRWGELAKIIDRNITAKNIQIYFPNSAWENIAQAMGAGGEIKNVDSDYLMVVDSNFGAFKSDAVMKKNLTYIVTENNSSLSASLKLDYRHEGGFDWRTTRYRDYIRIYAPRGSKFISLKGIDSSSADFSASDDPILNKTVFGFFFTVEPGSSQAVTLEYRLPDTIKEKWPTGDYRLLVQKQAGQRIGELTVSFQPLKAAAQQWTSDFSSDKSFYFTGLKKE